MDMDAFQIACVDMVESTGKWPLYPFLPMKRWVDERNGYEFAVIKHDETTETYGWYDGETPFTMRWNTEPTEVLTREQVEKKIEQGWVVD